jgi:hypothetical protein
MTVSKKVTVVCYLEPWQVAALKKLSKETGAPVQFYSLSCVERGARIQSRSHATVAGVQNRAANRNAPMRRTTIGFFTRRSSKLSRRRLEDQYRNSTSTRHQRISRR